MSEHQIQQAILLRLGCCQNLTIWRNNTGAIAVGGRFVRFGAPGSADLLGVADGGQFIAIEVKAPRGRQSERQKAWQMMIERHGGVYVLARSVGEAVSKLREQGIAIND